MTGLTAATSRAKPAGEADPRSELQDVVDRLFPDGGPIAVLEAGCGSATHIGLGDNARIVGIDISEDQLARNSYISRKIVGDVQTYDFDDGSFDLIMCWDVLEHLPHPEKALKSFARAVMADGVILLALPNDYSLKRAYHEIHAALVSRLGLSPRLQEPERGKAWLCAIPDFSEAVRFAPCVEAFRRRE